MDLDAALKQSAFVDQAITSLVNRVSMVNTDRRRLSGGAFLVALDIHASMLSLAQRGNYPSMFILSRPIWEANIRGYWLLKCATDDQLTLFLKDRDKLKAWKMIEELEAAGSFERGSLSAIHSNNWPRLNTMTHVSGPLIARCNSTKEIAYDFDAGEIIEVLQNGTAVAILAACGIAESAVDHAMALELSNLMRDTFPSAA